MVPMSERLFIPSWFRVASRGLAAATIVGLSGCIVHDLHRVPVPFVVGMGFASMGLFGGPAFILLRLVGVDRGYVPAQDGRIYTVLLIAVFVGMAILIAVSGSR